MGQHVWANLAHRPTHTADPPKKPCFSETTEHATQSSSPPILATALWDVNIHAGSLVPPSFFKFEREFPSSPVVMTWCFPCWESGSIPGWGTNILL